MSDKAFDLFEAIDVIVAKKLEGVNFDATLKCTIVDDSNADQGRYKVSTGTSDFIAYSENKTYKNDNVVQVLVPNNDYSDIKLILGKWTESEQENYTYQRPFSQLVDMSGNLALTMTPENGVGTLVANNYNDTNAAVNSVEDLTNLFSTYNSDYTWKNLWFYDFSDKPLSGYSKLGLAADFRTQLASIQGDFGLRITIKSSPVGKTIATNLASDYWSKFCAAALKFVNIYKATSLPANITLATGLQTVLLTTETLIELVDIYKEMRAAALRCGICLDFIKTNDSTTSTYNQFVKIFTDTSMDSITTKWTTTWEPIFEVAKTVLPVADSILYTYSQNDINDTNFYITISNWFDWIHSYLLPETLPTTITMLNPRYRSLSEINAQLAAHNIQGLNGNTVIKTDSPMMDTWVSYLTTDDMIGSIYDSIDYYRQEKVFDISECNNIYYISVDMYEQPGTFFELKQGEIIATPYLMKDAQNQGLGVDTSFYDATEGVPVNIFAKDLYVCVGYAKDTYNTEQAILYTADSETYSYNNVNAKTVSLRWIHKDSKGNFNLVSDITALEKDFIIKWYQQDYSSSGDQYAGNYWKLIEDNSKSFNQTIMPRGDSYQQENIKCVIIYGVGEDNPQIIHSNIVSFYNTNDLAQEKLMELKNEDLSIVCEDKSAGIYPVYNEQFIAENCNAVTGPQHLQLHLNSNADDIQITHDNLSLITSGLKWMEWRLPLKDTMLTFYCDVNKLTSDSLPTASTQWLFSLGGNNNDTLIIQSIIGIENDDQISNHLTYTIDKTYSPRKTNNSIQASILQANFKDKLTATLNFKFSQNSTNGYPYVLTLSPIDSDGAVKKGTNLSATLTFNVELIDQKNHELIDLNNVSVSLTTGQWTYNSQIEQWQIIFTYNPTTVSLTNVYAISGTLTYNDCVFDIYYPLSAETAEVNPYIINPLAGTVLYYNSDGSLDKYTNYTYRYYNPNVVPHDLGGEFLLTTANVSPVNYLSTSGSITSNKFAPLTQYFDDMPQAFIVYVLDNIIYWSYPIITKLYRYPYKELNNWNGVNIEINEDQGYLLAPRLGAGKKHNDNTFSGVILGDWASQSNLDGLINGQTGIYGFSHGEVTYAFKEDGTAFIGPSGSGRIEFNGQKGIIKSGNYDTNNPTTGMLIDLDDGKIDIINSAGRITIDASNDNALFQIAKGTSALLGIGDSYYLQSLNYEANSAGTKFNLTDGYLETHNGVFTGTIYATAGEFKGSINVNNKKFYVDTDGNLIAKAGYFDGVIRASQITGDSNANLTNFQSITTTTLTTTNLHINNNNFINIPKIKAYTIAGLNTDSASGNATIKLKCALTTAPGLGYQIITLTVINNSNWNLSNGGATTIYDNNNNLLWTPTIDPNFNGDSYTLPIGNTVTSIHFSSGSTEQTLTVSLTGSSAATAFLNCASSLYPNQDNALDLGSQKYRWKTIHASTATIDTTYNSSARQKKTNITPFILAHNIFFDNLLPCQYQYINQQLTYTHKGFVVDEVCAAAVSAHLNPEDCGVMFSTDTKDPNDPNASLCYTDFIALNTWQIQLLKKRVSDLEEKIKKLEDKLNEN